MKGSVTASNIIFKLFNLEKNDTRNLHIISYRHSMRRGEKKMILGSKYEKGLVRFREHIYLSSFYSIDFIVLS